MRKKLFAILMSAMMMVTFMPSMAFAETPFTPEFKTLTHTEAEAKAVAAYFANNPHEIGLDDDEVKALEYKYEKSTVTGKVTVTCTPIKNGTPKDNWVDAWRGTNQFTVTLTDDYTNPNMKAVGKKVHLGCGQDLQVYACQTPHCGYETFKYLDRRKNVTEEKEKNHPDATVDEMTVEEFVKAFVKEQADEYLANLNSVDLVMEGGILTAGTAKYLAEQAAIQAGKAFWGMIDMLTPKKVDAEKVQKAVTDAFMAMFMSISPIGISFNAGLTAKKIAELSNTIIDRVEFATMSIMVIVAIAADTYYGVLGGLVLEDNLPVVYDKNGKTLKEIGEADFVADHYNYEGSFGLQNICKMIVTTCPDCGILDAQIVEHKNSKGACATNYVCDNCGKKVWNVKNILASKHARIVVVDTNKELPPGDGDLVLPAGKLDVNKLDCATTISYKCADCGESMISLPLLKKDGHDLQPTTLVKATKLTKGIDAEKCSKCGLITNVKLTDRVQHTHDKSVEEVVAPTCSMPGYTVVKCSCGQFMGIKSVVAPKKHEYKTETLVEPTCESKGIFRIYCANCDASKVIIGSEKKGEMYDLAAVMNTNKPDTLDALSLKLTDKIDGLEDLLDIFTKWDGKLFGESVDGAKGHIEFVKIMTAKSSTYDRDDAFVPNVKGWTTTYYFTGFGHLGLADAWIEVKDVSRVADAHDFLPTKVDTLSILKNNDTKKEIAVGTNNYVKVADANCTTPALWAVACKNCGAYDVHGTGLIEVGTKNGHKYEVTDVAATCEHTAGTISVCATCGDRVVTGLEEIKGGKCEPTGIWETTLEPTFVKVGTRVMYCTKCNQICKYDDVAVKKLGKAYQPTLKAGKKQFTAKFKNVGSAATGVQIAYKVTGTNNYKYIKTEFKKSKTVKGLKGGKKYTVKVRKYKVEDGKTVYGAWCAVKYVTTKK